MLGSRHSVILGAAFMLVLTAGCTQPWWKDGPAVQPVPVADLTVDPAPPIDATRFELAGHDQEVVGELQMLIARHENTFREIARRHNLGFEELEHANPAVDAWLPGEGTPVYLPTLMVLPDAPREGIVLNLPSMRLTYFETRGVDAGADVSAAAGPPAAVTSHPIGIGREGWATPIGDAVVTTKVRDPVWYPPASVRAEHTELGDPLPAVVQPGPDNPLGRYAMLLSMPGYLIHGTNKPAGVGMRVSHGCIRMYPEHIEALFDLVPSGTPVTIVDQPALAGWRDGVLYLEVHPPLAEDGRDLDAEVQRILDGALRRAGRVGLALNESAIARIVAERRGIPFPVSVALRSPDHFLVAARLVENDVPVLVADLSGG